VVARQPATLPHGEGPSSEGHSPSPALPSPPALVAVPRPASQASQAGTTLPAPTHGLAPPSRGTSGWFGSRAFLAATTMALLDHL
jgi:hypothetical protein